MSPAVSRKRCGSHSAYGCPLCRTPLARMLRCELLEDRRLLAQLTVTTDQDIVDLNDDQTSLREAIFAANIVPGPDEIVFDFGHDGPAKILLTQGELRIADSLTITGAGAELLTIDASGSDATPDQHNGDGARVFHINDGDVSTRLDVHLRGLRITGGDSLTLGGAIYSLEDLFVSHCAVTDNSAVHGGGIHAVQVEIVNSIVSGNVARAGVGGRDPNGGYGGGINAGALVLARSAVQDNWGRLGSGIMSGHTVIEGSTIAGNIGSGLHQSGELLVSNSAIVNNTGTGISLQLSTGTVHNSTISGNGSGGVCTVGGHLQIEYSTITNNRILYGAGGGIQAAGPISVRSSIVAENEERDVTSLSSQNAFLSKGYNLIGTGNGAAAFTAAGDQVSVLDPYLGPLTNNGGPTLTHALLPGSPAINAGDPSPDNLPEFDQRGEPFVRVFAGRVDIGAYERQSFVVDTLDDENDGDYGPGRFSLREAIELVNFREGADTIEFSPALFVVGPATISLAAIAGSDSEHERAAFFVKDDLTIRGPGAELLTIDAFALDPTPDVQDWAGARIFYIDDDDVERSSEVRIEGLTLTGGDSYWGGSAILSDESLNLVDVHVTENFSRFNGGAIFIRNGHGRIERSLVSGNVSSAGYGGGISAGSFLQPGRFTELEIIGSSIVDNRSRYGGGGVYVGFGNLAISSSTIAENVVELGRGGGVYADGSNENHVVIVNSTVHDNRVSDGGGIAVSRVQLSISDSTISHNLAYGSGGGIAVAYTSAMIKRSTIVENHVTRGFQILGYGGGIRGSASLENTIVWGNSNGTSHSDDIAGSVIAIHSLIGSNAGTNLVEAPLGSPDANGNLIGGPVHGVIDPLLGPLADNGGPTLTHALLPGSSAINAGDPSPDNLPEFDQRGAPFARVAGGRIDIGALESQPAAGLFNGDFDGDGDIDGRDFLIWQRGYGHQGLNVQKSSGDTTGNQSVDGNDLAVWRETYRHELSVLSAQRSAGLLGEPRAVTSGMPSIVLDEPIGEPLRPDASVDAVFETWLPQRPSATEFGDIATRRAAVRRAAPDHELQIL